MSCVLTIKVQKKGGGVVRNASISIDRCFLSTGARSTSNEVTAQSDSSGIVTFTVPENSKLRFTSTDVPEIQGNRFHVPSNNEYFYGVVFAEPASIAESSKTATGVGAAAGTGVTAVEYGSGVVHKTVLTLLNTPVTLVKNGTSSGGGGTKIYDFPEGLILPLGAVANLVVANALDKSFLASLGSAAADTGGTLTSTEITFGPSTAATTSTGAGTCKIKSTVLAPVPGVPIDGTGTPVDLYLNSALNADATGAEALTYTGTITIHWINLGDN